MAPSRIVLSLGLAAAAASASALAQAPAGTAATRYCMRVEAFTGSHVERIRCWTRAKWASQGVDVDSDWAKEGVRTIA
jgi:hypothetical protein